MRYLLYISLIFVSVCILITSTSNDRIFHPRQWNYWCNNDWECGRGICQGDFCRCYRGFITWRSMHRCMYEQRTKLRAFLLSFFVGIFGVDWFYLSRGVTSYMIVGIMKLLISLGCFIGWPIFIIKISKMKDHFAFLGNIISVLFSLTSFLWWLTDWIRILANVFPDGYGAPLHPWGDNSPQRISYPM